MFLNVDLYKMHHFFEIFLDQIRHTSPLEWTAVVCAVAQVLLAYRNIVWNYLFGIASTLIYVWLFIAVALYAEASLNGYYFVMSIYGWIVWTRRTKEAKEVPVTYNTGTDWLLSGLIVIVAFAILYTVLKHFTPSTTPLPDAWVSAFAWSGMWLMARRKVENWLLLNISNAIAVPLLIYKGMAMTAVLTIFLFVVATVAFFSWRKRVQTASSHSG